MTMLTNGNGEFFLRMPSNRHTAINPIKVTVQFANRTMQTTGTPEQTPDGDVYALTEVPDRPIDDDETEFEKLAKL